jgi:hypothetical protein
MQVTTRFKYIFLLILVQLILTGCSVQKKISRKYTGKKWESVVLDKGHPTRTVELENNRRIYVYEKSEEQKATPINTGAFRYDPVISPAATRKEFYYFYISANGVVERVKYEELFE